ncbi:MAG: antirestriction protein ArdA, partial [Candidatus Saccharimonadales bacterium]
QQHGPAFAAWAELHDADPDMLAAFEDAYLGEYDSPEAWAELLMEESGSREAIERLAQEQVGDLARYVRLDSGQWAQDAWLSGDITVMHKDGGGVWIFNANP